MISVLHDGKPIDLKAPLFVRLINANATEQRDFAKDHGDVFDGDLPAFAAGPAARVETAFVDYLRQTAEFLLSSDFDAMSIDARRVFLETTNMLLLGNVSIKPRLVMQNGLGRLVFEASSLAIFMALELAAAVEVGARSKRCERCDKFILHGPQTGHKRHAKFCSDRCKAAAMRARKAVRKTEGEAT